MCSKRVESGEVKDDGSESVRKRTEIANGVGQAEMPRERVRAGEGAGRGLCVSGHTKLRNRVTTGEVAQARDLPNFST